MRNQARDGLIEAAYRSGISSTGIARAFGLTSSRVLQILRARDVSRRKYKPPRYTGLDLRRKSA